MKEKYISGYVLGESKGSNLAKRYEEEQEDPVLLLATDYFNENKGKITKKFILKNMKDEYGGIEETDEHLYEVIKQKEGYCYKLYFDIDKKNIELKDVERYDKMLSKLLKNTRRIMKDKLNYEYGDEIIKDASREIKGKYKYSKHIILPVYLENTLDIYHLYTYLFNYYKGEQYGIPTDMLLAIDNSVYTRSINGSKQMRLIGNTKMGEPKSILKGMYQYSIKDTLITQFNKEGINILDKSSMKIVKDKIDKISSKFNTGQENIKSKTIKDIKKYDDEILPRSSKYDVLNLPIKKKDLPAKEKTDNYKEDYDTPKMLLEYYKDVGFGVKEDIKIYLSVIPNTIKNKIPYEIWIKIAMICKKYEVDYKVLEDWTIQAYNIDEEIGVKIKCKRIWDNLDKELIKLSVYLLIDIAKLYNPDIYIFMRFAYDYHKKYNIDKTGGGKWDKQVLKKDEELDVARWYKEGNKTIICDAGVGYGKTTSVIKMIKENIDDDIFVIAFSNRKIFATELAGKFKDSINEDLVFNYDENRGDNTASLINKKVLVVSFESLLNYKERILERINDKTKLMMVYDENETLLKNLTQDILEQQYNTADLLLELWIKSSLNIILDAYMTNNTIEYVKEMNRITNRTNDKVIFLDTENNNKNPKTFRIKGVKMTNPETNVLVDKIVDEVVKVLNQGTDTSVVIDCEELRNVEAIVNAVLKRYKLDEDEYLVNTGLSNNFRTEEEIQKAKSYFINTKLFKKIRLWIYNSSVMNGVSIEEKKFDKAIVLFSVYSINPENRTSGVGMYANDILNGLARARLNDEWDIYAIVYEKKQTLFAKSINGRVSTKTYVKKKLEDIYSERKQLNKQKRDAKMLDICEQEELSVVDIEEKQKRLTELQKYLSLQETFIQRERNDNIEFIFNTDLLGISKKDIKQDIVAFSISKKEYEEFRQMDMLNVLARTTKMYECILRDNTKSSKLNAVYKQYVFMELATMKGNKIIDETDKFLETGEQVNMRTINVECMKDTGITQVSIITNFINKYYGETWLGRDTLISCCKKPNVWRMITKMSAILDRTEIKGNDAYNPLYLLSVLDVLGFNFDELPEAFHIDDIKEGKLYDTTKSIFDSYKKANNIKILKEATEAYKPSSFMRDFNNLLSPLSYKYKRKGKNGVWYELEKPKIEATLILNGKEENILLLPDDIEYMFLKRRKDIFRGSARENLEFIEDEDE